MRHTYKNQLKQYFKQLLSIGITPSLTQYEKTRIKLSNLITLSAIVCTIPFALIYTYLSQSSLGIGIIILCILYSTTFILNHLKLYNIAKFTTTFFPNIGITLYFIIMGPQSGIQFILFPSTIINLVLFHPKQKKWLFTTITIPILLFITFQVYGKIIITHPIASPSFLIFQNITSLCITFIFLLLSIKTYVSQQINIYDHELTKQKKIKTKLSNAIKKIEIQTTLLENYSSKDAYIEMTKGIAHEIKNPMTILLSGAELLKDNIHQDQKSAIEFADIIIKTMNNLNKLTSSMLKQNKPLTDMATPFKLKTLLEETLTLAQIQCKHKHIKLTANLKSSATVFANRTFVSQAFLNIIINAIQHTSNQDTITITLENISPHYIEIKFHDTGKGISENQLPHIFKRNITSSSTNNNYGLGLAFVKKVIEEHQATIKVHSKENEGSTFIIHWPIYDKHTPSKKEVIKKVIISK